MPLRCFCGAPFPGMVAPYRAGTDWPALGQRLRAERGTLEAAAAGQRATASAAPALRPGA